MNSPCVVRWHRSPAPSLIAILIGGIAATSWGCRKPGQPGAPSAPGASQVEPGDRPAVELSIAMPKAEFRPDETIELWWTVTNRSSQPITLWSSGFWPNHRLVVRDTAGTEARLTEAGRERRALFGRMTGKKNVPIVVQPGEHFRDRVATDLELLYDLVPGRYHVELEYQDHSEPTPLHLFSNRVTFTIAS